MKALADAATEGPWELEDQDSCHYDNIIAPNDRLLCAPVATVRSPIQNARFIAAMRTDVVWMEAVIRAVMKVHAPRDPDDDQCAGCLDIDPGGFIEWPCATVRAVQDAMTTD